MVNVMIVEMDSQNHHLVLKVPYILIQTFTNTPLLNH